MLCEKCKKNYAVIFYEENINGKTRKYALCKDCADELQRNDEIPTTDDMFDTFYSPWGSLHDSLFGSLIGLSPQSTQLTSQKKCQGCGSTFDDFRRRGKAGCPECYRTFTEELEPTIRSIHGNANHNGRAPSRFKVKFERDDKLKTLKKELKEAISSENFEKAAELRDEIKKIEGGK